MTGFRAADLTAELASARLLLESSCVAFEYECPPPLGVELERPLALVLREAVTNIARHADATHVRVGFGCGDGRVRMRIADNGCGGIDTEGNGLAGIRERVRALGGSLAIASPRGGTTLEVMVPLPAASLLAVAAHQAATEQDA